MKKDNWILVFCLILYSAIAGVLVFYWQKLPPQIPWFYSLPWGERQLIDKTWFAACIGLFAVVSVISQFLAKKIAKDDEIVRTTMMSALLVAAILFLMGFFRVMQLFLWI